MATHDKTAAAVAVTFHNATGAECAVYEQPASMRLTFGNGDVTIVTENELGAMARTLMWHGAKQKFVDAAAIPRNPETGRSATLTEKITAVLDVVGRVTRGEWNKAREGGTGGGGLLFTALCRMYEGRKTPEAIRAYLDGLTDAEQGQLRRTARVATVIEQIRAERAKNAGTNGEELLAGLDD
jgi:hypothetical protein